MARSSSSSLTDRWAASVLAPLGEREAQRAVEAAVHAVEDLGCNPSRLRVYPPQLRIDKPARRDGAPTRHLRVPVRDRDQRVLYEVVIDADGRVEDTQPVAVYPPPTAEEVAEARHLAETEARVEDLVGQRPVQVRLFAPGHGSGESRTIGLEYLDLPSTDVGGPNRPVAVARVVVNIDDNRVVAVTVHPEPKRGI